MRNCNKLRNTQEDNKNSFILRISKMKKQLKYFRRRQNSISRKGEMGGGGVAKMN